MLDNIGDGRQHMLAVVYDDKRSLLAKPSDEVVDDATIGRRRDLEATGELQRHSLVDSDGCELDHPAAIGEHCCGRVGDLDGHTRLTRSTDPDQCHQPMVCQLLGQLGDLSAAADKGCQLHRDIADPLTGDTQPWEVSYSDLIEPLG